MTVGCIRSKLRLRPTTPHRASAPTWAAHPLGPSSSRALASAGMTHQARGRGDPGRGARRAGGAAGSALAGAAGFAAGRRDRHHAGDRPPRGGRRPGRCTASRSRATRTNVGGPARARLRPRAALARHRAGRLRRRRASCARTRWSIWPDAVGGDALAASTSLTAARSSTRRRPPSRSCGPPTAPRRRRRCVIAMHLDEHCALASPAAKSRPPGGPRCPSQKIGPPSTSSASTRSAPSRWTRCRRPTPAIPGRRWRSRRSPTCSTRGSWSTRRASPTGRIGTASCSAAGTRRCSCTRRCT